jgi:hypothetical protein
LKSWQRVSVAVKSCAMSKSDLQTPLLSRSEIDIGRWTVAISDMNLVSSRLHARKVWPRARRQPVTHRPLFLHWLIPIIPLAWIEATFLPSDHILHKRLIIERSHQCKSGWLSKEIPPFSMNMSI